MDGILTIGGVRFTSKKVDVRLSGKEIIVTCSARYGPNTDDSYLNDIVRSFSYVWKNIRTTSVVELDFDSDIRVDSFTRLATLSYVEQDGRVINLEEMHEAIVSNNMDFFDPIGFRSMIFKFR